MYHLGSKDDDNIPGPPESEGDEGIATDDDAELIGGELDDDKNNEDCIQRSLLAMSANGAACRCRRSQ